MTFKGEAGGGPAASLCINSDESGCSAWPIGVSIGYTPPTFVCSVRNSGTLKDALEGPSIRSNCFWFTRF